MGLKKRMMIKDKLIKGIFLTGLCALTVPFMGVAAEASDYDYYGAIDSFTGEPDKDDENYSLFFGDDDDEEQESTVWVSDYCYYDYDRECYVYPVDDEGGEISCTVCDGMIVQNNVDLSATDNVVPTVYINGTVSNQADGQFTYAGSYVVTVMNAGEEKQVLSFTICGNETNNVMGYAMPDGFDIISVTLDGEEVAYSGGYVDMSQEGKYYIAYECYENNVQYALNLEVDITAPVLTFEGLDEDGKARGPVNIVNEDPDASVAISKDGKDYPMVLSYVLTQSGKYVVTVTDKAGNSSEYQFIIMIYLDSYGIILLIMFVLIIIAAGAYVYYTRTHLKTR